MSPDTLLHGFAISGYRSFVEFGVPFAPLGQVNLFAGQNNAGKSNVLRFVNQFLNTSPPSPSIEVDRPQDVLPQDWAVRARLFFPELRLPEAVAERVEDARLPRILEAVSTAPGIATDVGVAFGYVLHQSRNYVGNQIRYQWVPEPPDIDLFIEHFRQRSIDPMIAVNILTNQTYSSGPSRTFAAQILEAIAPKLSDMPPTRVIQAFRQIRPRDATEEGDLGLFDGMGLVERLQQLESPRDIGSSRDEARAKYEKINRFVRHILDDQSATLHIPFDASTVQIQRGHSVLPLESLGTGVHQVVMLAAAATLLDRTLIGLEEPEVHLHPLLQRRLVRYLASETNNQYLIATHSAHLLDYEAGRIFHLTYGENGTEVAQAGTAHELAKVCADLGYRPSDLLQSNAVIWVEGPSDRIYLRRWIQQVDPDLIEGIHYSVMFYGGGLLRHLSPEDPGNPGLAVKSHSEAIDDFISLRRLNRHLAVVIDSDKDAPRRRINPTKRRVVKAFEDSEGPGHAWVTNCYTIENYVPRDLLEQAVNAVHPRWELAPDEGDWRNPLRFRDDRQPDKVSVARYVADSWRKEDLKRLGLDREIRALAALIRAANGHT